MPVLGAASALGETGLHGGVTALRANHRTHYKVAEHRAHVSLTDAAEAGSTRVRPSC